MNYVKDWCIKITSGNKVLVRDYLLSLEQAGLASTVEYMPPIDSYCWNTGSFYGIDSDGYLKGSSYSQNISKNILTYQEFSKMLLHGKTRNNYEIC